MGVNQMTGTAWHVETLHSGDDRRHKTHCGYYDGGFCSVMCSKCKGSAHCVYYSEDLVGPKEDPEFQIRPEKKDSPKKAEFVAMDMSQFKVGTRFLFCQKKREKKGDRLVICEVKQVKPNGIVVTLEPTEEGREIKYPERTFKVIDMNRFRGFVNEG